MKKSLLITLEFPPQIGGVGNYLFNIVNYFPTQDIVVLAEKTPTLPPFTNYKVYQKKLLTTFKFIWPKWIFLFFLAKKIIKKESIKYIQVSHALPVGTVALMIKKYLGLPYLVYTHGMDILLPQSSKRKTRLIKSIFNNADRVIANSRFTKDELLKLGVDDEKITIVHPCANSVPKKIDLKKQEEIVNKYHLKDKKILFTVGRLVTRKGHDLVIKSLRKVIERFPNVVYLVSGDGPNKQNLINLTDAMNLSDKVIFLGEISDDDLQIFYRLCNIFIMPAREIKEKGDVEGFGLVFLEASLFAKPVIGGKSGGQPDAIEDGYSGLLVNPNDEYEIANTIIKLLESPELAEKLGQQGRQRVLEKFRWDEEAKKIINLLS